MMYAAGRPCAKYIAHAVSNFAEVTSRMDHGSLSLERKQKLRENGFLTQSHPAATWGAHS